MKVLLIDDHPLILAALQSVISGLGDDVLVQGVASAHAAREALKRDADYDLALLDLQLGEDDGFDLLIELRSKYPALPVVVVSGSDRAADVIRAIDLGAMGFVPKRASNDQLFEALHLVMSGGVYVPTLALSFDGSRMSAGPPRSANATNATLSTGEPSGGLRVVREPSAAQDGPARPRLDSLDLTPRQAEVLALLLQGKPNKLIARDLGLSVETVKDHVAAVLRVMGVSSRTQVVLEVARLTKEAGGPAGWRRTG